MYASGVWARTMCRSIHLVPAWHQRHASKSQLFIFFRCRCDVPGIFSWHGTVRRSCLIPLYVCNVFVQVEEARDTIVRCSTTELPVYRGVISSATGKESNLRTQVCRLHLSGHERCCTHTLLTTPGSYCRDDVTPVSRPVSPSPPLPIRRRRAEVERSPARRCHRTLRPPLRRPESTAPVGPEAASP